jgi:hypothetical protein
VQREPPAGPPEKPLGFEDGKYASRTKLGN